MQKVRGSEYLCFGKKYVANMVIQFRRAIIACGCRWTSREYLFAILR